MERAGESIQEIKNFLLHIQPRVGEAAFGCVWEAVENLERAASLEKYLEKINEIMWNTWGLKDHEFGREEGKMIMQVLDHWASRTVAVVVRSARPTPFPDVTGLDLAFSCLKSDEMKHWKAEAESAQ